MVRVKRRSASSRLLAMAVIPNFPNSETAPIIPFYSGKGILKRVDGVGDPDLITQRITAVLNG